MQWREEDFAKGTGASKQKDDFLLFPSFRFPFPLMGKPFSANKYGWILFRSPTRAHNFFPGTSPPSKHDVIVADVATVVVPLPAEVQCDHPESTKDGFIEVSNFKGSYVYGSRATYHCNPGFILWGEYHGIRKPQQPPWEYLGRAARSKQHGA